MEEGQLQLRGLDFRQGDLTAELTTLTGERLALDLSSANAAEGRLTLQLDGLAPGIYLLRLEQSGVWATRKVIIR